MSFLTILGGIIGMLAFIIVAAFCTIAFQYLLFFKWRNCKHCHHHMDYGGLKEDNDNGHYLFHCPHCGAWEQVPREAFFKQWVNPLEEMQ